MKIETRFNVGDNVVTINYDRITTLQIVAIECYKTKNYLNIKYTLLVSKSIDLSSKDLIVVKDERECFESIQEQADFYKTNCI